MFVNYKYARNLKFSKYSQTRHNYILGTMPNKSLLFKNIKAFIIVITIIILNYDIFIITLLILRIQVLIPKM